MLGSKDHFHINTEDDVVRGSLVLHNGELVWPPKNPVVVSPPPPPAPKKADKVTALEPQDYFKNTMKDSLMYTGGEFCYVSLTFNIYSKIRFHLLNCRLSPHLKLYCQTYSLRGSNGGLLKMITSIQVNRFTYHTFKELCV